jgi:hypothetical protein
MDCGTRKLRLHLLVLRRGRGHAAIILDSAFQIPNSQPTFNAGFLIASDYGIPEVDLEGEFGILEAVHALEISSRSRFGAAVNVPYFRARHTTRRSGGLVATK